MRFLIVIQLLNTAACLTCTMIVRSSRSKTVIGGRNSDHSGTMLQMWIRNLAAMPTAIPAARLSRSRLVLRCHGSMMSMALALSIDSSVPMRANMTTHFHALAWVSAEKSGVAKALNMLFGTDTR